VSYGKSVSPSRLSAKIKKFNAKLKNSLLFDGGRISFELPIEKLAATTNRKFRKFKKVACFDFFGKNDDLSLLIFEDEADSGICEFIQPFSVSCNQITSNRKIQTEKTWLIVLAGVWGPLMCPRLSTLVIIFQKKVTSVPRGGGQAMFFLFESYNLR
jgi:hypothetical protein